MDLQSNKKIMIIIAVCLFFLCILVFVYFSLSKQDEQQVDVLPPSKPTQTASQTDDDFIPRNTDEERLNRPTPDFSDYPTFEQPHNHAGDLTEEEIEELIARAVERGEDPEEVRLHLSESHNHHDEGFADDSPVTYANIFMFDTTQRPGLVPMPRRMYTSAQDKTKTSLNDTHSAKIDGNSLIIQDKKTKSIIQSVKLENETMESNFAWLTDTTLVLIEKQNNDIAHDYVYVVDTQTGKKTFTVTSIPSPSRFNLKTEPEVFNNGEVVLITDNKKGVWLVEFRLKE